MRLCNLKTKYDLIFTLLEHTILCIMYTILFAKVGSTMSRGFGQTEICILKTLKNLRDKHQSKINTDDEPIVQFTYKQICEACKKELTKEQVHSALGRLVRRGTVWKSNGKRPQTYWILPGIFKLKL